MENDVNKLCLHCMQYGLNEQGVCGYCGRPLPGQPEKPYHLTPRSILAGKYMVARVLGEGGFGITYLAWDINLEMKIAIKEYYPSGCVTRDTSATDTVSAFTGDYTAQFTQGRERFVDEARKLAKFHQLPGIVAVRDFFSENGTAYIVMEFIEGITLKERLEQSGGRLPEAEALALMRPLVKSLGEVHRTGIIHRDISPDNIMLTPEGGLRLLDFGAARNFSNESKSLSVLLKHGYAPEEQYRSRGNQGPWTDIYALCATLYRAIEGEKPPEAMERMLEDTFTGFTVPVSGRTQQVLARGLAVRQENRWQTLDEMYAVLYEGAPMPPSAGAPPVAPVAPPPAPPPAAAPGKKRWVLPAAIAAVVVVAVIVLAAVLAGGQGEAPAAPSSAAPGPAASAAADGAVLTLGNYEISYEEYRYHFLSNKTIFESSYGLDVWDNDKDGEKERYLKKIVLEGLQKDYAWIEIAKELEIELDENDRGDILDDIAIMKETLGQDGFARWLDEHYYRDEEEYIFYTERTALRAKALNACRAQAGGSGGAPALITAKHILVSDEEKAREILQVIRESNNPEQTFTDFMLAFSEDPGLESNPDGYTFAEGEMVQEFYEAAAALEIGGVSDVVKTQNGYHIILRLPGQQDSALEKSDEETQQQADRLVDEKLQKTIDSMPITESEWYTKAGVNTIR